MSSIVDTVAIATRANDALKIAESLPSMNISADAQLAHCKMVVSTGLELVRLPGAVIGNQTLEDVIFRIKQCFEKLQAAFPTIQPFADYLTLKTFTGQIHSNRKRRIQLALSAAKGKAKSAQFLTL
ncbi:hypothetical protein EDD18DRAFT_1113016 [Armillaria luteobubalina]|uniref:Uncharacterized protein n=1 Tax=Armillaria luteobubalina TaxID=153913 RepID=A0AA39PBH3_9AGAR|nr:hypothetical protein EDD18DRAFT_1113016 [Armillaria luteobubalina]